ncbi:hypothetical protein J7M23_08265 [Candidatus Sumerlaeota bacterium]|nr:hypothetical protein [Candidatus Sumerlaeota bacterium]
MCGEPLNRLDRHPSALTSDDENQVLIRHDYCPECWAKVKDHPFFCRWIAKRFPRDTDSKRIQRQSTNQYLLHLFHQLQHSDDPNRTARLFILAHLLLRLREFNWCGYEIDPDTNKRVLVFEKVRSRNRIHIPEVKFTDEQLAEAQNFVDEILKKHHQSSKE